MTRWAPVLSVAFLSRSEHTRSASSSGCTIHRPLGAPIRINPTDSFRWCILAPVLPGSRQTRSPTIALLFGLIITLAAVVAYSLYITGQIAGLRQLQSGLTDRNRKDSLQLLRIQNDLNSVGLAMRDMLDGGQPYPLTAWATQFHRLRIDLDDALAREAEVTPATRTPEQRQYLGTAFSQ